MASLRHRTSRRARGPKDRRGARGVVYLEVVTCLVPVLVLFFCAVQLSLWGIGRLVVTHAATRGARAAIVVLEDDPEKYGGAPRGDLNASGGRQDSGALADALRSLVPGGLLPGGSSTGGARLQAIREAVYAPLAALAPAPHVYVQGRATTLYDAVGGGEGGALTRFALGVLVYARAASVVTVRAAPGSTEVLSQVAPRADVTVHVTYLQHCAVPIAARLMCNPAWDLAGYGRVVSELQRLDPTRPVESARILRELRTRFPDPRRADYLADELARAESPGLLLPLMLGGGRFRVIEAEATLPNQGAAYVGGRGAVAAR